MPVSISMLYVTASDSLEAEKIAKRLLTKKLVACVNIIPVMRSLYWWKGNIEEASESILIAKTQTHLVPRVVRCVKDMHSYECPCVVAFPLSGGNPDFLEWIAGETRGD